MRIPGIKIPEPPHKHGFALWVYPAQDSIYAECSACFETVLNSPTNYCPNCGALMVNTYDARLEDKRILETLERKGALNNDGN
jgi:hypothetical protein